jgi:hypothetical protein
VLNTAFSLLYQSVRLEIRIFKSPAVQSHNTRKANLNHAVLRTQLVVSTIVSRDAAFNVRYRRNLCVSLISLLSCKMDLLELRCGGKVGSSWLRIGAGGEHL